MKLTKNQQLFCHEYLKMGMNGTKAYMKVYKSCKKEETARTNASRLLTKANIKNYISELQNKVEEKAVVSIGNIVDELAAIAFIDRTGISSIDNNDVKMTNTDKLTKNQKKVIASYKETKYGVAVETYDKLKALELLGKYLGMFKETVKIENPEATKILSSISKQLGGKSE